MFKKQLLYGLVLTGLIASTGLLLISADKAVKEETYAHVEDKEKIFPSMFPQTGLKMKKERGSIFLCMLRFLLQILLLLQILESL